MMIDADCIVTKDLSELIIYGKDLQICYRGEEAPDIPYLGSFVLVHNNNISREFVKKWAINIDNNPSTRAKESPMLGKTILEFGEKIKVDDIPRITVSCYSKKEYDPNYVYVIHLKGGSISKDIEQDHNNRIYGTHGFDSLIKKYLNV